MNSFCKGLCRCCLVEVGGGAGAVRPVRTPLHVCVGGLGASLPSHPGYEPLRWAAAWEHTDGENMNRAWSANYVRLTAYISCVVHEFINK